MFSRPRSIVGVIGILAVAVLPTGCQAYRSSGVPQAGAPYGYGTPASRGPAVWTPVAGSTASPSPGPSTVRGTTMPPRRPVRPRRLPATQVPQVGGHQHDGAKAVALTFDDGPGEYTEAVLRVLRRERVPATFFVLGKNVVERPADVRKLTQAGMSVQSHTWDHRDLTKLSSKRIDAELGRTNRAIERAAGVRPTCVRPPFGATDYRVQRRIAHAGQVPVTWNVDTDDWAKPGAKVIAHRAVADARPGAIVLMHDGGGTRKQTVAALPSVIHQLRAKGYTFAALCSHTR